MTPTFIDSIDLASIRSFIALRLVQCADIYRSPAPVGGMTAAPALLWANQPIAIVVPTTQTGIQTLSDLGGGRASALGEMAWDADVTEGDQVSVGSITYLVERAVAHPNVTILALSELLP